MGSKLTRVASARKSDWPPALAGASRSPHKAMAGDEDERRAGMDDYLSA